MTSTPSTAVWRPRFDWRACITAAATLAATAAAIGAVAATPLTPDQRAALEPVYTTIPHAPISMADVDRQAAMNRTIPHWTASVTSPVDGTKYSYTMVGKSPFVAHPTRTFFHVVQIVARVHFADGTVLDPTGPSACDAMPVTTRFFKSPLFKKAMFSSNGVDVSGPNGEQLELAFQRANFWSAAQGSNYGFLFEPNGPPIIIDVTAPAKSQVYSIAITCPSGATATINLGAIPINAFDKIVQRTIAKYAKPHELPLFLTYDVVQTAGGCCIIGYHNAVPVTNGTQTYAVGTYSDPGVFTAPIQDIAAWSHELGEWTDDPFINNATPAWGHTGQVGRCQNNLEVGDPLTGSAFNIVGDGGFTYTYQDLAYKDWFFRTPAMGTGGMYSFQGLFTTDAGAVCK